MSLEVGRGKKEKLRIFELTAGVEVIFVHVLLLLLFLKSQYDDRICVTI